MGKRRGDSAAAEAAEGTRPRVVELEGSRKRFRVEAAVVADSAAEMSRRGWAAAPAGAKNTCIRVASGA